MTPPGSGARVKGLAFRTVLQELGKLEGPAVLERVVPALPAQLSERLRTGTLASSSWYPLEEYAALWDVIQRETGNRRDFPRVLGRLCVAHDLNVVHKLVFRALSVFTVVSLATRVFKGYYDTGEARAKALSDKHVRVLFDGCTGFTAPMWSEIRGSVEMFAEQASSSKAWSTWHSGAAHLDPSAILDVYWK